MAEKSGPVVIEEQTGKAFEIIHESRADRAAAIISVVYSILMILFWLWQLFDMWVERYTIAKLFGYSDAEPLTAASTLIGLYTFIGGALGGVVNEIRGILFWHCDHEAFGRRYLWKSILAPWLGGTLGISVYFLMRSGIALFTGEYVPSEQSVQQEATMLAIGFLTGYGSRKVFIWLDHQVTRLFKFKKEGAEGEQLVKVPDLMGMTKEEAEVKLAEAKLTLGKVSFAPAKKKESVGKVLGQETKPDLSLGAGSSVDIIVGNGPEDGAGEGEKA